jgi:hypothetical protein
MYTQSPKPQSVKEVRKAALKAKNIGAQPDSDKRVHVDVYLKNKNEYWLSVMRQPTCKLAAARLSRAICKPLRLQLQTWNPPSQL